MEVRKKILTEKVVEIICDICKKSCFADDDPHRVGKTLGSCEFATLQADWGYFSDGKDLTYHHCHMCEKCFDKVKAFIENELKGAVRESQNDAPFLSCRSPYPETEGVDYIVEP